ncbi:hypothetical protein FB451DRAFT_1289642 [Mycena latifolia]|nr:hypothetical protein FB451DRAFT_1289642 [Mycena latifolia]
MDLPQELIDSIVDAILDGVDLAQDPWIIGRTVDVLRTLRSYLPFHGVTAGDDERKSPNRYFVLFSARPHLASYVHALRFEHRAVEEHHEPIAHILASVKTLVHLHIYPDPEGPWMWNTASLRAIFSSALALPSLRHIALWYFSFEDALELQTLLSESTGLKTLVLNSTTFGTTKPPGRLETTPKMSPRVVLDSLELYFMDAADVQAILDSFTTVDLTRLGSLYLRDTPISSLFNMTMSSIQHLTVDAYYPEIYAGNVDADALAGAHYLQSLDFTVPSLPSLTKMLRLFGSLEQLSRLRTLCLTVSRKTYPTEWQELDALLGVLPALGDVHVYSGAEWTPGEPHEEALMRTWMPVLAGRNVLRIHT